MRLIANLFAFAVPLLGIALPLIALETCSGLSTRGGDPAVCPLPIPFYTDAYEFAVTMVVASLFSFGIAAIIYVIGLVIVGLLGRAAILFVMQKRKSKQ